MSQSTHRVERTIDLGVLGEVDLLLVCNYEPGDPGRYSGPPEKCYPATASEVAVSDIMPDERLDAFGLPFKLALIEALNDDADLFEDLVLELDEDASEGDGEEGEEE
jgi:hypothetical protein